MKNFSYLNRNKVLSEIEEEDYDVIIIGGGITGTGIALDCTTRGLKTLLVEMQDFAAGTSSRSTKLIHGGLRYLKQFEVKMVADVGKERAIVYENAPHVTHPEWMLLPIYKKGTFGKYSTSIGLQMYDYLAGVKRNEKRKMLSRQETIQKEPLLKKEGLLGGGYYVEYRTDDARLTIEVAKKAVEKGADLLNYTQMESFLYRSDGQLSGVYIKDMLTGDRFRVNGKKIVNASGPWVEKIIGMDRKIDGKSLLHTKGVHIVIDGALFPLRQPVYFDTSDGRMVFAIPRNGKAYVGTTDTVFEEDLQNPIVTVEDKKYLLECIKFMFPTASIGMNDIESTWSGVRPLIHEEGKGPSEISRKDEVWTSETGLITIAGGKLTGYRKMAETVTNLLSKELKKLGVQSGNSITKDLKLSGGDFNNPKHYPSFIASKGREITSLGISIEDATNIVAVYGTNTDTIANLANEVIKETELPFPICLTLHYAINHEMILTPVDFFMRRTGTIFFDINWVETWKLLVIDYMAQLMEWTIERKEELTEELELRIAEARA
ncbi:MAG TPA: glycerol-3-phosphate dehydrogenase/oxidase [Sporosarcina psychrophila]|uniref:Glycerol-3-phosphate dehydrogenase n=1 Tax=Sporosarcina psychrophila TaxID=1476 RepID=A0A921G1N5_SPOPS|nr:glycerol-3-phosphate dehydrogenase/oxidase [Sporosarcina psychrophila]